jgi:pyruvate, water dikinase
LDQLDEPLKAQVANTVAGYPSPRDYFVTRVAEGVATLAAAFAPKPVIVRMSDFKSNEYANLIGGELYEPHEENPMIGYRGASRYLSADFADCFRHGMPGLVLRPRRNGTHEREDHDSVRTHPG